MEDAMDIKVGKKAIEEAQEAVELGPLGQR
jgi:hypothetical protein